MDKMVFSKKTVLAILVLIGIIGPVYAQTEDCPSSDPNTWSIVSSVYAYSNIIGNKETYLVDTINKPGSSIKELCIYPNPGYTDNSSNLTAIYSLFQVDRPDSQPYFGFLAKGTVPQIPLNGGTNIQVGSALYSSLPSSELFVIHLTDSQECGSSNPCWRRPSLSPLQGQVEANPKGPYNGTEGILLTFDGSTSTPGGNIVSYNWNFGDGHTGAGINPSHIYVQNGTYTVTLTVTDGSGNTNSSTTTSTIADRDPASSFLANPSTGNSPLRVNFSDTSNSYDGLVSWSWDFNNDNITDSALQNPTYTYSSNGTYTVSLKVCDNDGGCSTSTGIITVSNSNIDTQPPSQPLCPVAIVTGPTSIFLNWQPSTDNVGVVGYKIYRGTDSSNLYYFKTVSNANYSDTGLTTGVTYYYSIVAIDAAGNPSIGSDTVFATPRDITPPTVIVPRDMTVEATSPAGAIVNFSVSATDDIDPNPIVSCNPSSGSTFHLGYSTVTCTATDATGNVGSAVFSIRIVDTTPPTAPSLTATAISSSEIDLSWSASYDAVGVTNYLVYRSMDGSNFSIITSITGTGTTFSNQGLTSNTQYYYYVKAFDAAGNSNPSNIVNAITFPPNNGTPSPTGTPGGPGPTPTDTSTPTPSTQDFPPTVTVPGSMTVEATAPNGAIVTFNATAYDYEDGPETATCYPSSGSRFHLGTTYVTCTATDSVGNIGSAVFTINVVDTTPPSTPSGLSGIAVDSTTIGIGWNPSTDLVGVAGYNVYRSIDNINFAMIGRTGGTTFSNTGLAPNTTYYYYIIAYDFYNNPSGSSTKISAQTLPQIPSPPGTPGPTATPTPTGTPSNPCSSSPNTPIGQNVNTVPIPSINVNFDAVLACGQTSAVAYYSDVWSPLPSNYTSVNYYDINTTATYSNTITIKIMYSSSDIPIGTDANSLRLFHYENGNWVDITTALDTSSGTITGTSSSLSPFSIGGLSSGTTPGPTSTSGSTSSGDSGVYLDRAGPSFGSLGFIVLAICLVSISILRLRKT